MKILFVDDEPRILAGLRRMLFHLDEWEIECAESGYEALEILEDEHFDVLVTDMRMPGMDGAALLQEVHSLYPDMVRLVLSGYAELEAALRTVPVAHQFLTKPTKPEVLQDVVERACNLRTLLDNESVRKMIGNIENLPSVPWVFAQLTKALVDPDTNARAVSDIISQDPAMCAKVLQLVNSSFFFRSVHCTDVHQAVVRLGFQMVKNLVLSVEVFKAPSGVKPELFSMGELQSHSVRVASLAGSYLSDPREAEDAFMAGMLHDIGKLIIASELPDKLAEILELAEAEGISYDDAEDAVLGVGHAELGGHLLALWGLPYPIVEAVANHHAPDRVPQRNNMSVLKAVVQADFVAKTGSDEDSGIKRGLKPLWSMASEMQTG